MDLIERQEAIDSLKKMKIYRPLDSDRYVISDCLNKIVDLPSAQPEIIRCRECKYNDMPPTAGNAGCTLLYGMTNQNGFCSLAERREDNK